MSSTEIERERTRTSFAAAPVVRVQTDGERRPVVQLEYGSSAMRTDGRFRTTKLSFLEVVEYRWSDFELGVAASNPSDLEFCLIDIHESELVHKLINEGRHSLKPKGRRLGGVLRESDLHHYRICFDDHGTYDILGTGVMISDAQSSDEKLFR